MTENLSLAEQAVQALELVRNMDAGMALINPERHSVRALKRLAEQAMRDGIHQAIALAGVAKDLRPLVEEVQKESAEKAAQGTDA